MTYRLYLDESGDHFSSNPDQVGKRYLGLVGVAIEKNSYDPLRDGIDSLKKSYLSYDADDPPILHREDIVACRGAFSRLREPDYKSHFDEQLLKILAECKFLIFAVAVDKYKHFQATYRKLTHPYHYGLHALLERYCGYLKITKSQGDVLAESRGRKEDEALKEAYAGVYKEGTRYLPSADAQATLTSNAIKLKPKNSNITGLQIADLFAHPLTRDVLLAYGRVSSVGEGFAPSLCDIAKQKHNKHLYSGRTMGYGKIIV